MDLGGISCAVFGVAAGVWSLVAIYIIQHVSEEGRIESRLNRIARALEEKNDAQKTRPLPP